MKWNIPNILTMIRMACTPVVALLFLLEIDGGVGIFVALGVYVFACLTDFLDGYIARKYNQITDFGKFMDQIADKAITTTAMILVLLAGNVTLVWLAVTIVLVVILRDTIISGIRMVAANKNMVIAADIFGKIKSFFLDIASMVLMLYIGLRSALPDGTDSNIGRMPIDYVRCLGMGLMIVGAALAVLSCINYSVKAVRGLKEKAEIDARNAIDEKEKA